MVRHLPIRFCLDSFNYSIRKPLLVIYNGFSRIHVKVNIINVHISLPTILTLSLYLFFLERLEDQFLYLLPSSRTVSPLFPSFFGTSTSNHLFPEVLCCQSLSTIKINEDISPTLTPLVSLDSEHTVHLSKTSAFKTISSPINS